MAVHVELIDFYRPDEREKNLYLTGIPATLPRSEKWGKLYDAFSPYGLLYGIHLVEQGADASPLEYGFVSFYSSAAARRAQRELNGRLNIGGTRIRVQFSDRIKPVASTLLHSSRCQELANYYLGFHGWSSRVTAMESVPSSVGTMCYHCRVEIQVAACRGVCNGSGIGEVRHDASEGVLQKVQAIGVAKKQAFSRAIAAAFSRVILCILPNGKVGAHLVPSCDPLCDLSCDPLSVCDLSRDPPCDPSSDKLEMPD